MTRLIDWIRANPADTVDLTPEEIMPLPRSGDKERMAHEINMIADRAAFYRSEADRYRAAAVYATESAQECETLATLYESNLERLPKNADM